MLRSSRKEKSVWKNNHKETISDVINVSPTGQDQKHEISIYSAHNWKVKSISFALDTLLKPSVLSSGFLLVGTNNVFSLKIPLVFAFQMHRGEFVFAIKKPKPQKNPYYCNSSTTSIF